MKIKRDRIISKIKKLNRPYLIAEIGINHNGDIKLAKKMILSAKKNGADCVKFQLFSADDYISKYAVKAKYQKTKNTLKISQNEIIKKTQLNIKQVEDLEKFAINNDVDFLCTPFELKSFKALINLGVKSIKISSCNLNNEIFLKEVAKTDVEVLISTGMGNLNEVKKAVKILKNNLLIFQCTSNYPSLIENSNLNVIKEYKKLFGVPIGFSDHTVGNISAIVSVALGAQAIEKHFTISKKLPGIDQMASVEPHELKQLSIDILNASKSLGDSVKRLSLEEKNTLVALRRSLVASRDLKKGEVFTRQMIAIKRPGNGIPVTHIKKILGKSINKNLKQDQLIKFKDLV